MTLIQSKHKREWKIDGIYDFMLHEKYPKKEFREATGYDWDKFDNEISDQECIEQILAKRKDKYSVEFIETRRDGYFIIRKY